MRWTPPRGGHAVWVTLPRDADPDAVYRGAGEAGIAYARGDTFHFDGRGADSLALSFVNQPGEVITEGVALLGEIVARALPRRRSA